MDAVGVAPVEGLVLGVAQVVRDGPGGVQENLAAAVELSVEIGLTNLNLKTQITHKSLKIILKNKNSNSNLFLSSAKRFYKKMLKYAAETFKIKIISCPLT